MNVEIIFSYSGGMFPYYLGIAEVLQDYDLSEVVYSATSGGCFAPLLLNSKRDIRKTFDKILDTIKNNNKTWEEIHPEHLRIILFSLKESYIDGIFKNIIIYYNI